VLYVRNFTGVDLSWQEVFETDVPAKSMPSFATAA
jgi:hypothetical protein